MLSNYEIEAINEYMFMERLDLFAVPDVVLFLPDGDATLSEQLHIFFKDKELPYLFIPETELNNRHIRTTLAPWEEKERLKVISGQSFLAAACRMTARAADAEKVLLAAAEHELRLPFIEARMRLRENQRLDVLPMQSETGWTKETWSGEETAARYMKSKLKKADQLLKKAVNDPSYH
ncbi:hypothetical protein B0H94_10350 [Salsuginibacillus halophilus]|uniref:Uncharacterized protein n=1 Tax=Salsuginibacillus halophilus TaxID=517424 RepID=A0A2P8HW35_9BACI|nr:hypothetical protein [Salsuginibacillus halophilus]PSL50439.1 hypothetical protein B0H94_10350 [Salsuginibacillus halophilus]